MRRRSSAGVRRAVRSLAVVWLLPAGVSAQAVDTVRVLLTGDGAAVEQRLAPSGGRVRAYAMRLEGQTIEAYDILREGESLLDVTLTQGARAHELDIDSGAPIALRYSVTGTLDRIPLFVAGGAAELTVARDVEEPFLLRVTGPAAVIDEVDLATSLPRLRATSQGTLEVRLSSIPSLVRLVPAGRVSFARVADVVALLLIALGAVWAWRTARIEPSHAMEIEE